jgi:hypothetical protein
VDNRLGGKLNIAKAIAKNALNLKNF